MTSERFSSAGEERNGEGRGVKGDPDHARMINLFADAVMEKLKNLDPSRTLTADQKNDIERHLCRLLPVLHMPDHPTYAVMICRAIEELNEKHGSTEEEISKFIREKFDGLPLAHARLLNLHLKKLNERGEIVCVSKDCFMLPDSLPGRKRVPKQKQTQKGRGKRKSAKGKDYETLAYIKQTYKDDKRVEVTLQLTEDGQEIQDSVQAEQPNKVIEDRYGSADEHQDRVNVHENQKHMQEVALIVDNQNVEMKKHQVNKEQVELIEQKMEHVKQSEEPIQHMKVVDSQNGSSEQQSEQTDEVNQMQVTLMFVEKSNLSEQKRNVNEVQVEVTEQQVEVTGQQGEYGQQSQVASQEEQNSKVADCQNGFPEQQNQQQDDVNDDQLQEILISCEKQSDKKLKYKVTDEHMEVSMDEIIEEQCQTKEQRYEVIEQHSQGVKRDIQLHGEVVEAILTGPEVQQSNMISERNPHDQIELTSMQELLSKQQEQDAAMIVNSNVSVATQKSSHHVSSNLSEMMTTCKLLENNIKVHEKTHKLLENNIKVQEKTHKLLENNIKVQEKTLQFQEKMFELLKQLADTNRNPVIEERPMPTINPCGEREVINCGFPAKKKHQPETSAQTEGLETQLIEMSASLELPTDATELFLKHGKLCNLGQQQVPKFLYKSVKILPDVEQPKQQEIGNSERLWELPTMDAEHEALSGPVRKKICLSIEEIQEKEKQLEVHNPEGHSDLCCQEKQSLSLLVPSYQDVCVHMPNCEPEFQQPKVQETEKPRELKSLPVEGGIVAHVSNTNPIESVDLLQEEHEIVPELTYQENLHKREHEKQSFSLEDQQQSILSDVVKKPDCLVGTEGDNQADNAIKEKAVRSSHLSLELIASEQSCQRQFEYQEQQPQRELRPRGKKSAESDCGMATAPKCQERVKLDHKPTEQRQLCSQAKRHSKSELSLNTSMVELSPRNNDGTEKQTEDKIGELKTPAEETGQRQLELRQLRPRSKQPSESKHSFLSNTRMSKVGKPGAEEPYQLKRKPQGEEPGVGDPSQPKKKQVNHLYKRKWCTPDPTTMPNAIGATYQRESGQTIESSPEAFEDLGTTLAELSKGKKNRLGQQNKCKSKQTARESPDELALTSQDLVMPLQLNPAAVEQLPQTTKELPLKQQLLRHMKLRLCSQAASQSELGVLMIESFPQEQKHPEQPQKKRRMSPKPKLNRAGPAKHQKLHEQTERQRRPPKLVVSTSGRKVISKNKDKQPKSPGKAKPQIDQRKTAVSGEGKASKTDSRNSKESSEGEGLKG